MTTFLLYRNFQSKITKKMKFIVNAPNSMASGQRSNSIRLFFFDHKG